MKWLLLSLVASISRAADVDLAGDSIAGEFEKHVRSMRSGFLPGHLWTAPIILHPEGLNNTYCYNPSFTEVDKVIYTYVRCHSRDYFNPRYRRYHKNSWALIQGKSSTHAHARPLSRAYFHLLLHSLYPLSPLSIPPGGMNHFTLGFLPTPLTDLQHTVMAWRHVHVPLDKVPGHQPLNRFPGLQDARLFTLASRIWFVASSQLWLVDKVGIADYGPVVGFLTEDRTAVQDLWVPEGFPAHCRNIVPLVVGDTVYMLDSLDGALYVMEGPAMTRAKVVQRFPTLRKQGLRGGTNPILLDNGTTLGFISHGVYFQYTDPKHGFGPYAINQEYLHFWVEVELDTGKTKASRPFYILSSGIEFASSLLVTTDLQQVVIGLGTNDQEAWLVGASLGALRSLPRIIDDREVPQGALEYKQRSLQRPARSAERIRSEL